jgi:NAD(P)-dependent dehydrogenase (short-subunit alcohol dehydrogenase family)
MSRPRIALVTGGTSYLWSRCQANVLQYYDRMIYLGRSFPEKRPRDANFISVDFSRPSSIFELNLSSLCEWQDITDLFLFHGVDSQNSARDVDASVVERLMKVNFVSAFMLARELAVGRCAESQLGIHLMSSDCAVHARPQSAAYSASKIAIEQSLACLLTEAASTRIALHIYRLPFIGTAMRCQAEIELGLRISPKVDASGLVSPEDEGPIIIAWLLAKIEYALQHRDNILGTHVYETT